MTRFLRTLKVLASWHYQPSGLGLDLKELDILGDGVADHWYYRAKAQALTTLLGAPADEVLDIGAGSGFFSRHLLAAGLAQRACCVDPFYANDYEETVAGKPILFRRSIGQSNADVVLLMDVLEHVDDDVGLLREYVARVRSGSRFVISVPAFQSLWSPHDIFLEHRRRYRLPQIEQVATEAGLVVTTGCYGFSTLFPVAAATRFVARVATANGAPARSQLKRHSPWMNATLYALCRWEHPWMAHNRAFGLSAFCLAVKP